METAIVGSDAHPGEVRTSTRLDHQSLLPVPLCASAHRTADRHRGRFDPWTSLCRTLSINPAAGKRQVGINAALALVARFA